MNKKQTGFTALEGIIIIFVLAVLGFASWYFIKHRSADSTGGVSSIFTLAAPTNVWVGKGKTTNWSDSANWSLGTPKNGQNLRLNLNKIKITTDSDSNPLPIHDDLDGLRVRDLTFTSSNGNGDVLEIAGDTLTVTHQILNEAANSTAYTGPQLANNIVLDGDVTIKCPQKSGIFFEGDVSIAKNSTVHLQTEHIVDAKFGGPEPQSPVFLIWFGRLSGSGSIYVGNNSSVGFNGRSPDMHGKVTIASGAVAELSNTPNSAHDTTPSDTDGLGMSSINVLNGGNLEIDGGIFEDPGQALAMNIANDVTISGNGSAYADQNSTGKMTGVITSCITAGAGCIGDAPGQVTYSTVTFTGTVTLAGNSELGAITNSVGESPVQYTHTKYIFKNPIVNSHSYTLMPVPDSLVQIVRK